MGPNKFYSMFFGFVFLVIAFLMAYSMIAERMDKAVNEQESQAKLIQICSFSKTLYGLRDWKFEENTCFVQTQEKEWMTLRDYQKSIKQ